MSRLLRSDGINLSKSLKREYGVPEALLLQQIHYHCTGKNSINWDGHSWAERTLQQWAEEIAFEKKTVERALVFLIKSKVVAVDDHGGKARLYRINHYMLDRGGNEADDNESPKRRQIIPKATTNSPPPIKEENIENMEMQASPVPSTEPHMKVLKNGKGIPVKIPRGPMKADAILAKVVKDNHGLPDVEPNSKESFKALWYRQKQLNPDLGDWTVPQLSNSEVVSLGSIASQWGATADQRLKTVLSQWGSFNIWLAHELGWDVKKFKYPARPSVFHLRKHQGYALNYADQQESKKPEVQPVAQTAQKPQPKVKIVAAAPKPPIPVEQVTREEEPATNEDVLALMKEFGVIPEGK
jgi:hypothetical protein